MRYSKDNWAELFTILISNITGEFGESAQRLIIQTVRQYGLREGEKVRETVGSLGLEPNLDNFKRFNQSVTGRPVNITKSADHKGYDICHCPIEVSDVKAQGTDLKRLACVLDIAMVEGYNPELVVNHSSCIRLGSGTCHYISQIIL